MADNQRKNDLLRAIVEEYVESANPVGSGLIVEKYFKNVSSATIRNDMVTLEEDGLICQPHTSAGRVPTVAGYKFYLDNFIDWHSQLPQSEQSNFSELEKIGGREGIKSLAKKIAEFSSGAVLVGFKSNDVYYTGISNLFRQPEFSHQTLVYSISDVIDHLDEVMSKIFNEVGEDVQVLIGEENPFGSDSAVVLKKYQADEGHNLIGILGPSRMDYQRNINLLNYSQKIIK